MNPDMEMFINCKSIDALMGEAVYLAVMFVGLIHGLDPGHGWPLALLYAANPHSKRPMSRILKALISSMVISYFHLISSLAVVAAYMILKSALDFSLPYLNYVAGAMLLILGIRYLLEKPRTTLGEEHGHVHDNFKEGEHEHEHEHPGGIRHTHPHRHAKKVLISIRGIAVSAFFLGFAHEEEFALLALAVGGIDPLALMLIYGLAVTAGLVGVTIAAVMIYGRVEEKLKRYEGVIPKLSGMILLIMAASFLIGLR